MRIWRLSAYGFAVGVLAGLLTETMGSVVDWIASLA